MDRNKLKRLLEAFYDGTATLEDEQNLYLYFTSANVSEELEAEKRVFLSLYNYYLSIDDEVEVPSSLNNKLDSLIDNLSERERSRKRKISLVRISAIAASFLILISVGVFVLNNR
ncbi:MAG: hypothetical protein LBG19_11315 [Prevotellaceae bacterium]|nr:hypothetical protein [Prevotellaceae bacterium]